MKSAQTDTNAIEASIADVKALREARRNKPRRDEKLDQLDMYWETISLQIKFMEEDMVIMNEGVETGRKVKDCPDSDLPQMEVKMIELVQKALLDT
jgi:hypothetical protein